MCDSQRPHLLTPYFSTISLKGTGVFRLLNMPAVSSSSSTRSGLYPEAERARTALGGLSTFGLETPVWQMVQRGEAGAGEEENGLPVEKRLPCYSRLMGTDLQPKYDRSMGWVSPFLKKESSPQPLC